jgi:hypothetical protein
MATTLDEFIERHFPDGKCPEYPFHKRSKLVSLNRDWAANLHALIPEWAGDWLNFAAPVMRHTGRGKTDLPGMPMSIVSSAVASAVQENMERRARRGLEIGGSEGTSVSTYTQFTLPSPATLPIGHEVGGGHESPLDVANMLEPGPFAYALAMLALRAESAASTKKNDAIMSLTGGRSGVRAQGMPRKLQGHDRSTRPSGYAQIEARTGWWALPDAARCRSGEVREAGYRDG